MESIQYSLVVRSKDGKQSIAAGTNGSSAADDINSDLTFTANVRQLLIEYLLFVTAIFVNWN